jgi:hypothetical protein
MWMKEKADGTGQKVTVKEGKYESTDNRYGPDGEAGGIRI